MKSRATLKFTSASSNATRTSRKASATFSSEIFPSPRRFLKTFWSLLDRLSNMRATYGKASVLTRQVLWRNRFARFGVARVGIDLRSFISGNLHGAGFGLVGYPSGQRG